MTRALRHTSRPQTTQPQDAARLAPEFADAEVFLLGSSFLNVGIGGVEPSIVGDAVYGTLDETGFWFGPTGPGEGLISLPNTPVSAGTTYSGCAVVMFPALLANGTIWSNWYDASPSFSGDPGFWIGTSAGGAVSATYQDAAVIHATPNGTALAGVPQVICWSYDSASGRCALAVNGQAFTTVAAYPTETAATIQSIGGYYNASPVGLGEKRFYLFALWGREMDVETLARMSASPEDAYAMLLAPQTVVVAPSSSSEGLASVTLGALTLAATGAVALRGDAAATLAPATLAAAAALPAAGAAAATLSPATLAATGQAPGSSIASITLDAATATAIGTLRIAGAGAAALAPATLAAAATVAPVAGSAAVALEAATLSAAGTSQTVTTGAAAITLGAAAVVAAGVSSIAAALGATLAPATAAATARVDVAAALGIALGDLTLAATGGATRSASLAVTLAALTVAAAGRDGILSVPSPHWRFDVPGEAGAWRFDVPSVAS